MNSTVIEWLLNFGALGIVVILLVLGELVPGIVHRNLQKAYEKSQQALEVERQRNQELLITAVTGARMMSAINQVAQERHTDVQAGDSP